jgi:hypothetical protein
MNPDRSISIPEHIEVRDVGTEFVLMVLQRGSHFGLNPVRARIWTLLADGRTLGEVAEAVCSMYQAVVRREQTFAIGGHARTWLKRPIPVLTQ